MASNIILSIIIIFLFSGLVLLYNKVKQKELLISYKDKRILSLEKSVKALEDESVFLKNQVFFFYTLLKEPLVAFANGNIRKTYEIRSNNNAMTRVKVNKIKEPSLRKTFKTKLYYNFEGTYVDSEQVINHVKEGRIITTTPLIKSGLTLRGLQLKEIKDSSKTT
jgi:hypothetical protein